MDDAEKNLPSQGQLISAPVTDGSGSRFWMLLAMGAVVLAIVIGAVVIFGHKSPDPNANKNDPYAAKLKLSDLHMSTAENFAGGSVTYIEGKITNTGDKKITGARVELVFKDSIGQIAQQEILPVTVVLPNSPYVDYGSLDLAPLGPGQARDFRLTLEHVSTNWDRQIPQAKVVGVSY